MQVHKSSLKNFLMHIIQRSFELKYVHWIAGMRDILFVFCPQCSGFLFWKVIKMFSKNWWTVYWFYAYWLFLISVLNTLSKLFIKNASQIVSAGTSSYVVFSHVFFD